MPKPSYFLRPPLAILTPPTIPNVGPQTLFRRAWKRDTQIVMQELNEIFLELENITSIRLKHKTAKYLSSQSKENIMSIKLKHKTGK